ncbi:MAG TPA: reverse transcriptase domain-containing protein, partial [Candidatus Brocadiales bacterium]|nr:reverse transcriptase domain-containing protein [Candidatus Brocadiales bacterium]
MKQEILDIEKHFTIDALRATYDDYKSSKTDRFTGKVNVPMGADGVTWYAFEKNLEVNLANISRRVLNGSYHFYPMREFKIPKPDGGMRTLSIACIRDAIVQRGLYFALQESSEEIFKTLDDVSFAYRKGQSGGTAALHIWDSFKQGFLWAFDADIKKFFDPLDHERLMGLVAEWVGEDSLARKLIWRFIRISYVPADSYPKQKNYFMHHKPKCCARPAGVPQGGVLSGMLANLYLHEFDRWVVKELSSQCELRYYRYADDFVIL